MSFIFGRRHIYPRDLVWALSLITSTARFIAVAPIVIAHATVGAAGAMSAAAIGTISTIVDDWSWSWRGRDIDGFFWLPACGQSDLNGGNVDSTITRILECSLKVSLGLKWK